MTRAQMAGLAGALVVVLALGSHVTRWTGFGGIGLAGATLLASGVVVLIVAWFRPGSRMCGRTVAVRTAPTRHGTRTAALHEAGHYHVAKRVGGKVTGAEIYPDGSGVTWLTLPRNVTVAEHVAVDVAGHVASGTSAGCGAGLIWSAPGSDFDYMDKALRTVPSSQRAAEKRAGYALAGKHCAASPIKKTAKRLLQHGRVS